MHEDTMLAQRTAQLRAAALHMLRMKLRNRCLAPLMRLGTAAFEYTCTF